MADDPNLGTAERNYADIPRDPDVSTFDFNTVGDRSGKFDFNTVESRAANAKLLETLREAKPSALTDGFGIRGRQPTARETTNEVRRTDAEVGSITRRQDVPDFGIPATVEQTTAVAAQITPFFVTKGPGTGALAGKTVLRVYPGKIASIVPTLGGTKLDATPRPTKLVTAIAPFSLFLRANISVDTDNLFRSLISAVKVSTDDDADVIPDVDGTTGEVPELKIFWENPALTVGHFYLKIADLTVNGASEVTAIIQWLFDSYSTFVATASEAIIVI